MSRGSEPLVVCASCEVASEEARNAGRAFPKEKHDLTDWLSMDYRISEPADATSCTSSGTLKGRKAAESLSPGGRRPSRKNQFLSPREGLGEGHRRRRPHGH
jgi:hypothetical protein